MRKSSEKQSLDLVRHSIITSILNYKKRYGGKYGELVIACDYHSYWRTEIFPHYKGTRKKSKEDSDLPWGAIYMCMNQVRNEIYSYFPWKVICVPRCEADDIRAVLTKYVQSNQLCTTGIFDEPQEVLIVASDGDDVQLTQYDGVKQWCPTQKKFISRLSQSDLKKYMIEHVVKGDTGDGVPNIFTRDDFFLTKEEGERQKSVTQGMLDLIYEHGIDGIDQFPRIKNTVEVFGKKVKVNETDSEFAERVKMAKERFIRNQTLVLYDSIPADIEKSIIEAYNVKPLGNLDMVRNFFIKNRMRLLMEELSSV